MDALQVHLHHPPGDDHLTELRGLLDPAVELTMGAQPPDPARYSILVSGRPSEQLLDASPMLSALIIPFAGVPEATRQQMLTRADVAVHNLHHNASATAEMAVALMLAAAKRLLECDRSLRVGDWTPRYDRLESLLLEGRTVLVVGYGAIGSRVGTICAALGMRVLAVRRGAATPCSHDPLVMHGAADPNAQEPPVHEPVEMHQMADLAGLLPQADVLVLALPLSESTRGFIGRRELGLLPPGGVIVNVSRGPVIDEAALFELLAEGRLGAAGLDVWWRYPDPDERRSTFPSELPFHELPSVVMSPHRAGSTDRTESRRMEHLARLLNAASAGDAMPNRVDLERGY